MKRFRNSIILLVVLGIISIVMLLQNRSGTFRKDSNSFAVTDTASITKFFLADKKNNTVKIERTQNGSWLLNDKHELNPTMVQVMLYTFMSIDIKEPVAKATRNTIIRVMAGKSVKTEIYQKVYRINLFNKIKLFPHEKLTRTYYVGDATMDNSGTFMLMEGSEDPYVVNIPGFRGFVSPRYSAFEGDWRSHSIYKFRVPDISSVTIKFNEYPAQSYKITNRNNDEFVLTSLADNRPIENYDTAKVVQYLSVFKNLNYEAILDKMTKTKRDSIVASVPTYEITLVDKLGKSQVLKTWKRIADPGQLDLDGIQAEYDYERMYGQVNDSEQLVAVQYFVINEVLMPVQFFLQNVRTE